MARVLLLRTGWMQAYVKSSPAEKTAMRPATSDIGASSGSPPCGSVTVPETSAPANAVPQNRNNNTHKPFLGS